MQILLLRHGEAVDHPDDYIRPLTARGRDQAALAGKTLHLFRLVPDKIFMSPLLRAQETAGIVADLLGVTALIPTEYLTPMSDHRQFFDLISPLRGERILLVGHEPHLSAMISLLTTGTRAMRIGMQTGGLALCDTGDPATPGGGALRFLLPPETTSGLLAQTA
ncbi:MAG TPA: phosphohistidine phosphatase SixA [Bacteroidota bacterium]|nr:phosphohistidine phosphatase SixA [Bacteroidota bacterium]